MEMTNKQFTGVINMIKALIQKDTPKEELIVYLDQLAGEDSKEESDKNKDSKN